MDAGASTTCVPTLERWYDQAKWLMLGANAKLTGAQLFALPVERRDGRTLDTQHSSEWQAQTPLRNLMAAVSPGFPCSTLRQSVAHNHREIDLGYVQVDS